MHYIFNSLVEAKFPHPLEVPNFAACSAASDKAVGNQVLHA